MLLFTMAASKLSAIMLVLVTASAVPQVKTSPPMSLAAVPFVGCPSDGQEGPLPAPHQPDKHLRIPASYAAKLAYFQGEQEPAVLGPRDWNCFATYGSNGASIYLSPEPHTTEEFFSGHWNGFSGPAVQLSFSDGGTSGRFEVAKIVARVFPKYKRFVTRVVAENIEPASDFPFGPWPHDRLAYKNDHVVEYTTPANTEGLGTQTWLKKNNEAIYGVVIFEPKDDTGTSQLALRLPPSLSTLGSIIVHQVEAEY